QAVSFSPMPLFRPGDEVELTESKYCGKRATILSRLNDGKKTSEVYKDAEGRIAVQIDETKEKLLAAPEVLRWPGATYTCYENGVGVTRPLSDYHKPKAPRLEVQRLLNVALHGKPRAAIRAFRALTAVGAFPNEPAARIIELWRMGRPAVAAA